MQYSFRTFRSDFFNPLFSYELAVIIFFLTYSALMEKVSENNRYNKYERSKYTKITLPNFLRGGICHVFDFPSLPHN